MRYSFNDIYHSLVLDECCKNGVESVNRINENTHSFIIYHHFIFLSSVLKAQHFLFQNPYLEGTQVELKVMKPFFDNAEGISFLTGIYEFQVSTPISSRWNFVGNLPLSYAKFDFSGFSNSSTDLGNPYLAIQSQDLTIGVFLPLFSEDGSFIGVQSNLHDFHKYAPDVVTVYSNYQYMPDSGSGIGFEVGPRLYIPTEDGGDVEMILHYGVKFISDNDKVGFSAEYNGWYFATEDLGDFSDQLNHMLSGGVFLVDESFIPSLFYSIYLKDELNDDISGILGIKLRVKI